MYTIFCKNLFLLEHEPEKFPKFKNILRTQRLRKDEELIFWILHKIMEI